MSTETKLFTVITFDVETRFQHIYHVTAVLIH